VIETRERTVRADGTAVSPKRHLPPDLWKVHTVLVDRPGGLERLNQIAAANHLQVGARLGLESDDRRATSPRSRVELFQWSIVNVREATYFFAALSVFAMGWSSG
jgi:hypothetical protein